MDAYTDRLSDYLDGEDLAPRERAEIERHVAACAECRGILSELRAIAARAASLPERPPAADLWPGVATRLDTRRVVPFRAGPRRRISFTVPQLVAASLALMLLTGTLVWMSRIGGPRTDLPPVAASDPVDQSVAVVPAAFADAQYDAAIADLEKALEAGRDRLDPQTVRVLEDNLMAIDRAIEQCRQALHADPANVFLNTHLADARKRKLALLRSATAIASAS